MIPVYNEQRVLRENVLRLHRHMVEHVQPDFQITIADNASVDDTPAIGAALARELARVGYLRVGEQGRGRALRAAWSRSGAELLAYMDVDLSTDLSALPGLLDPLRRGEAQLAIGSRLAPGARVTRGVKRELISRGYNRLLRRRLGARFSDAQCGFKAGRRAAIQRLLPKVADQHWFFDTELLYLAQCQGLRIAEVPVHWIEDRDSRVKIVSTIREDLRGIARLRASTRAPANIKKMTGESVSPPRAVTRLLGTQQSSS